MTAEYEILGSEPTERDYVVQFVGGTAAVTKVYGRGVTVTYVSTGLVDIVWSANETKPGTFVGVTGPCFRATTAANVKGYSIVHGDYNTTTRTVRVSIYDASNNLVDLAAAQWLTFKAVFLAEIIGP
jgi:hypothetical protein